MKGAAGAPQRDCLQEDCCYSFSGWMPAELEKFSLSQPKLSWTSSRVLDHYSWWASDTCESRKHLWEVFKISCLEEPLWGPKEKIMWDMWSELRNWGSFMKGHPESTWPVSRKCHVKSPCLLKGDSTSYPASRWLTAGVFNNWGSYKYHLLSKKTFLLLFLPFPVPVPAWALRALTS